MAELEGLLRAQSNEDTHPDHLELELDEWDDEYPIFPDLSSTRAGRTRQWWTKARIPSPLRSLHGRTRPTVNVPFLRRHARLTGTLSEPWRLLFRAIEGIALILLISVSLVIFCSVFFPSYSAPPPHYDALRRRVATQPSQTGQANREGQKIFIATALYDPKGSLVSGEWGKSVKGLIDILGPENVHLSLYENDIDEHSNAALTLFEKSLPCNKTITTQALDLAAFPHVTAFDGQEKLKRVVFLAHVRNQALLPLEHISTKFDKILYINDVVFDPVDAANLLFSTNVDSQGRSQYRAACAVDFINPFKFYDTFATRDRNGNDMGVVFYPWFTGADDATSRNDVLAQKDAVRVKSCWGGMTAFEAKWFQSSQLDTPSKNGVQLPLRFRAETDTYWDASECCLIHADLSTITSEDVAESGIYMNPYVRVAYSKGVLDWLWLARRFERTFTPIQSIANWIARRPGSNPRLHEQPGEQVTNWVWTPDVANGSTSSWGNFEQISRLATPGAFCGARGLSSIVETPEPGGKKWMHDQVPELLRSVG